MIYAIILIIIAVAVLVFSKKNLSLKTAKSLALVSPLFIIWGTVGIVILTTARFGVFEEKPIYWTLLIIGSAIEILLGLFLVNRYLKKKKGNASENLFFPQNVLASIGIVVGVLTIVFA